MYEVKQIQTSSKNSNKHHYRLYFITKNAKNSLISNTDSHSNDKCSFSLDDGSKFLSTSSNQSPTILIVDEDEDILYSFGTLLKSEGYKVHVSSKPGEALRHIMEYPCHGYDLVILDIRMPDIDGINLFYWFKAIDPYMNILIVTALDLIGEFVNALPGINTNEIIQKPLDNNEFILKIREKLAST